MVPHWPPPEPSSWKTSTRPSHGCDDPTSRTVSVTPCGIMSWLLGGRPQWQPPDSQQAQVVSAPFHAHGQPSGERVQSLLIRHIIGAGGGASGGDALGGSDGCGGCDASQRTPASSLCPQLWEPQPRWLQFATPPS